MATDGDSPTPREFGRLEERVEQIFRDVIEGNARLSTKIDALSADFTLASTKQGERIGLLEQAMVKRDVEQATRDGEQKSNRRLVALVFTFVNSAILAAFGAWMKGFFG